jgi:hypothetical protein
MKRLLGIAAVAAAALAVAAPSDAAPTCTVSWDGPDTGGQWGAAASWSGDTLPGAGDRVCIGAGKTVTLANTAVGVQGVSVAGTLNVAGGTLTLSDADNASVVTGALNLTGGTLNGAADLSLDGTARWAGTTIGGSGVVRVPASRTLTVDGGGSLNDSRVLEIAGVLDLSADRTISTSSAAMTSAVHVLAGGELRRTTTTGTAAIGAELDNDGLVKATSGVLELRGGDAGGVQASTGDFVGDGGTVRFASGTYALGELDFSGVELAGGTVEVPAGQTLTLGGSVKLSGGTLGGAGNVTVDGAVRWAGGTMAGDGVTTVPVGKTLVHEGNTVLGGARRLEVAGTLELVADRAISPQSGATGFVHVASGGSVKRTTTAGTAALSVAVDNDGSITADTGVLELRGGTGAETSTGSYGSPDQGGFVKFAVGTHTLSGAAWLGHVALASSGTVTVPDGASVTASGANALEGGTLSGAGTFVASGPTKWTGGTMDGSGTTRIAAGVTMTHDGATALAGSRKLEVLGVLDLASAHDIVQGNGTGALVQVASGGEVRKTAGAVARIAPALLNAGTVSTSAGSLELQRAAASAHTGTFSGGTSDARIVFSGGTHLLGQGASVAGFATIGQSSTLSVVDGAEVPLTGEVEQQGSVAGAGTLRVDGRLIWRSGGQAAGTTRVSSGGTFQIDRCGLLLRDGRRIVNAGRLEIRTGGSVEATGTPRPEIVSSGTLEIGGEATGACAQRPGVTGDILVVNTGTIEKVGAAPVGGIVGDLDNDGSVVVKTGELQLGSSPVLAQTGSFSSVGGATVAFVDGQFDFGPSVTLDGKLDLRSQATIELPADLTLALDADTTFKMSGGTLQGGGTLRAAGTFQGVSGMIDGPTVVSEKGSQQVLGGTSGTFTVGYDSLLVNHGTGTWAGGLLSFYRGATMLNNGVTTITGEQRVHAMGLTGSKYEALLHNTGTIRNASGKSADLGVTIDNDGSLITDGAGMYLRGLTNYGWSQTLTGGTYVARNGWLMMPGILRTVAAKVTLDGATAAIMYEGNATTNALWTLEQVPLNARLDVLNGAVVSSTQDVRVAGRLVVGAGSRLETQKSYTQTGRLSLGFGSPAPGRVVAGTLAKAGGSLDLTTDAAFSPASGTAFELVKGATASGTFASVSGLAPRAGLSYSLSYAGTGPVATVDGAAPVAPRSDDTPRAVEGSAPASAPAVEAPTIAPPAVVEPRDAVLVTSRGDWTRVVRGGRSLDVTTTPGAALTTKVTSAKDLTLIAETCRTCGSLEVLWQGRVIKRISLRSSRRTVRKLPLATFTTPRAGTLKLRLTRGRAAIDTILVR